MTRRAFFTLVAGTGLVAALATFMGTTAQQPPGDVVALDNDDLGGIVRGPLGPEPGVWVIAETRDLPTKFRKIVVTDDRGRYVVPDLTTASYTVWVRGYGLVDSQPVQAAPGNLVNLTAMLAPNARAAAAYYPAVWTTYATRTPWHIEGGKGTTSKVVHFQIRPDPLAK